MAIITPIPAVTATEDLKGQRGVMSCSMGDQHHLHSVQYYSKILGINNIFRLIQSFIINSIVYQESK